MYGETFYGRHTAQHPLISAAQRMVEARYSAQRMFALLEFLLIFSSYLNFNINILLQATIH